MDRVKDTKPCPWFYGSDPEELIYWMDSIENYFRAKRCSDDRMFFLAIGNLRQDAMYWWKDIGIHELRKKKRGTLWERLKELLDDEFLPPSYRSEWYNQDDEKEIQGSLQEEELAQESRLQAIVVVQAHLRGWLARRNASKKRKSITMIQKRWRTILLKRVPAKSNATKELYLVRSLFDSISLFTSKEDGVSHYLHSSSEPKLLEKVQNEIISANASQLLVKEHSGYEAIEESLE